MQNISINDELDEFDLIWARTDDSVILIQMKHGWDVLITKSNYSQSFQTKHEAIQWCKDYDFQIRSTYTR